MVTGDQGDFEHFSGDGVSMLEASPDAASKVNCLLPARRGTNGGRETRAAARRGRLTQTCRWVKRTTGVGCRGVSTGVRLPAGGRPSRVGWVGRVRWLGRRPSRALLAPARR